MAVGAAVVAAAAGMVGAAGVSSPVAPADTLPEGGGTGVKKPFPELAVVDAAGSVVWVGAAAGEASIVGAGGGVAGTAAPEGVTTTGGGWGCGAFGSFIGCAGAAPAAA